MLTELDRGGDYIELSLNGRLTWNPLSATWLDSYSFASPVASRWNHLFSKGKEPFGQREVLQLEAQARRGLGDVRRGRLR